MSGEISGREAPGGIHFADGDVILNEGRSAVEVEVTNTGDRAVQVGSHFHFFEVNRALRFPRRSAFGMRLDIPSGTAVRFEAGQAHRVTLVPYGGKQRVYGFQSLTNGRDLQTSSERAASMGIEMDEGPAE